ncbi:ABC transporter substrate-binding protein [Devosia sp. 2618]|uniref:ABC transporter substrate-binding protein n=1 Tax=Devosia sp. 2618 TaxID=3156454 RepID=UPI0033968124
MRLPKTILFALALLATPVVAQEFPQVFEHKFGTTTLEAQPERVVSLGYSSIDHYLAMGVAPVAVREWYGGYPNGSWPWAQDALGDASITLIPEDFTYEQIAALEPDVIEAVSSGITAAQYAELSRIAPVVAPQEQYGDYGTPWYVQTDTIGRVLGKSAEAKVLVDGINQRIADIAAAHPEWKGMTAAVAFADVNPGAFRSDDIRVMTLNQLGFVTPAGIDEAESKYGFFTEFSLEDLSLIDTDLLVWMMGDDLPDGIAALTMRSRLKAHLEGREILADRMLAGAFSYSSPLSLDYLLDRLVPEIELAVDGDPATVVPSAAAVGLAP